MKYLPNSYWGLKFLVLVGLIVAAFFIPRGSFGIGNSVLLNNYHIIVMVIVIITVIIINYWHYHCHHQNRYHYHHSHAWSWSGSSPSFVKGIIVIFIIIIIIDHCPIRSWGRAECYLICSTLHYVASVLSRMLVNLSLFPSKLGCT